MVIAHDKNQFDVNVCLFDSGSIINNRVGSRNVSELANISTRLRGQRYVILRHDGRAQVEISWGCKMMRMLRTLSMTI